MKYTIISWNQDTIEDHNSLSWIIGICFNSWTMLAFPIWVFLISAFILALNYRSKNEQDGLSLDG